MRKTSKPIVAICGTSSKQGKFHIQLELRKRFQSNGYKLFQTSTEPTGYLFGMDSYQYMSALVGLEEEFCIEFPERYLGENIFDNVDRLGNIITECLSL